MIGTVRLVECFAVDVRLQDNSRYGEIRYGLRYIQRYFVAVVSSVKKSTVSDTCVMSKEGSDDTFSWSIRELGHVHVVVLWPLLWWL